MQIFWRLNYNDVTITVIKLLFIEKIWLNILKSKKQ
jgi:hypothetical protein